jgi:hypothetical protein
MSVNSLYSTEIGHSIGIAYLTDINGGSGGVTQITSTDNSVVITPSEGVGIVNLQVNQPVASGVISLSDGSPDNTFNGNIILRGINGITTNYYPAVLSPPSQPTILISSDFVNTVLRNDSNKYYNGIIQLLGGTGISLDFSVQNTITFNSTAPTEQTSLTDGEGNTFNGLISLLGSDNISLSWNSEAKSITINGVMPSNMVQQITSTDGSVIITPSEGEGIVDLSVPQIALPNFVQGLTNGTITFTDSNIQLTAGSGVVLDWSQPNNITISSVPPVSVSQITSTDGTVKLTPTNGVGIVDMSLLNQKNYIINNNISYVITQTPNNLKIIDLTPYIVYMDVDCNLQFIINITDGATQTISTSGFFYLFLSDSTLTNKIMVASIPCDHVNKLINQNLTFVFNQSIYFNTISNISDYGLYVYNYNFDNHSLDYNIQVVKTNLIQYNNEVDLTPIIPPTAPI